MESGKNSCVYVEDVMNEAVLDVYTKPLVNHSCYESDSFSQDKQDDGWMGE